jgi:hypothetical protein
MKLLKVAGLAVGLLLAILIGLSLVQIESTTVPEWDLTVVDPQGKPIEGALVRESWQNYSFEEEGHEEQRHTDATGHVVFPSRTVKASALTRIVGPPWQFARQFIHASYGSHCWVLAWHGDLEGSAGYSHGSQLPHRIEMRKRI